MVALTHTLLEHLAKETRISGMYLQLLKNRVDDMQGILGKRKKKHIYVPKFGSP